MESLLFQKSCSGASTGVQVWEKHCWTRLSQQLSQAVSTHTAQQTRAWVLSVKSPGATDSDKKTFL